MNHKSLRRLTNFNGRIVRFINLFRIFDFRYSVVQVHILKANGGANKIIRVHWSTKPEIYAGMKVLRTLVQQCFKVDCVSVILDQKFS